MNPKTILTIVVIVLVAHAVLAIGLLIWKMRKRK
jgi:succinate dehydrogenase/fumarate reductase cytochrome b subunit